MVSLKYVYEPSKFLDWDGDIFALVYRTLLKRWKHKLLGILLLFPVVYFLSTHNSTVIVSRVFSRERHNSLHSLPQRDVVLNKTKVNTPLNIETKTKTRSLPVGMGSTNWARLKLNTTEDSYTFISAYYDSRMDIPGRPAVIVFGYVQEFAYRPHLRCILKYSNGSNTCSKPAIAKQEEVDCLTPVYKKKDITFKTITCSLGDDNDVPEVIQFTTSAGCEEEGLSGEIPIINPALHKKVHRNRIGICVQGSLRVADNQKLHQDLVNFISMSQYMGADFITMYASPEELDHRVMNSLLVNYSHIVNLVEWKPFDHDYHGQFGLVYDCLYRHMHETQYLAFFDLDEMIIPLKHDNWLDMLDELEDNGGGAYPGYSFLNRMYTPSILNHSGITGKCANIDNSSVYLTWFNEKQCVFKHKERSKMILSPSKIVHMLIHRVCKVVSEKDDLFLVNKEFAINAHYRKNNLWLCFNTFTTDKFTIFEELLEKYTNSICKKSHV